VLKAHATLEMKINLEMKATCHCNLSAKEPGDDTALQHDPTRDPEAESALQSLA